MALFQTIDGIRGVRDNLESCFKALAASASDDAINKFVVTIDEISAEFPRLHRQMLGQKILRSLMDAIEDEFNYR